MTAIRTNLEKIFVWFGDSPGAEKITIGGFTPGEHFTIIFKGTERVIDIHRAFEGDGIKSKSYQQLFEMRFFPFMRFMVEFRKVNINLLLEFLLGNSITIGKMGHHNLMLTKFEPDEVSACLIRKSKQNKKIKFAAEVSSEQMEGMFFESGHLKETDENSFWVYSTKKGRLKNEGMIFRDGAIQTRRFYFLRCKTLQKVNRLIQMKILEILKGLDFLNKDAVIDHFTASL